MYINTKNTPLVTALFWSLKFRCQTCTEYRFCKLLQDTTLYRATNASYLSRRLYFILHYYYVTSAYLRL